MAMVIFLMLFTDFMRARTIWFDAARAPNGVSKSAAPAPWRCSGCAFMTAPHEADALSSRHRSARREDDVSADAPAAIAIAEPGTDLWLRNFRAGGENGDGLPMQPMQLLLRARQAHSTA
jgi:hypothetical protein